MNFGREVSCPGLALLLLPCACGPGAAAVAPPGRDDPALATARFAIDLSQQHRYHELELRRPDGSAALIWSMADAAGERRATTRLDLRAAGLGGLEFCVDPAAEQAVYLRDGAVAGGSYVLLLPGIRTRLKL